MLPMQMLPRRPVDGRKRQGEIFDENRFDMGDESSKISS
jgi:hypothetical protein